MVIWRITGDAIGPDDAGASYLETKTEADVAIREYKKWRNEQGRDHYEPTVEKVVVHNRADLCRALHDAMGYGAS